MTPDAARGMYRRQIAANGETITLRRIGSPDQNFPVRARVMGFSPEELVAGLDQADRKVIVLAEDVETSGFPVPFDDGGSDKVVLSGGEILNVQSVDDHTRRVGGVLIAYEIVARG